MPQQNIALDSQILTTLMSCGRLTDLRFNHHLMRIGGKPNSMEVGSIVHKFLEVMYGNIIKGFNRHDSIQSGLIAATLYIQGCSQCTDFEPTEEQPKPKCGHQINEYPGVHNTPEENESKPRRVGWRFALETCEQYVERWKNDSWIPLATEIVKGKVIYQDDNIKILWKAKLDSIFNTTQSIVPMDHKTMKQRRDTVSLNNQFMGQCIVTDSPVVYINKIGFQTSLSLEERFIRDPISYSKARLTEWATEIVPTWAYRLLEYHETGYWAPDFTHCENKYGHCGFKFICEAEPNDRERLLRENYVVGPVWDIQNEDENGSN